MTIMGLGGKPLLFKTPEVLQELVDKYFKETPSAEWTITGLALALGTGRKTLLDYEARDLYGNIIKKAKLMVENSYEKDLKKSGRTGTIFALKNFKDGWVDRQEIAQTIHLEELDSKQKEKLDTLIDD